MIGGSFWTFVIWPGVEQAYPDHARAMEYAESDAYRVIDPGVATLPDCVTSLEHLNALAEMRAPAAFIAAEELNRSGRCGVVEGGNIARGLSMSLYSRAMNFEERSTRFINEKFHWTGLTEGQQYFWRGYPETRECFSDEEFDLSGWRAWQDENNGYRDIRMSRMQRDYECGQQREALGRTYLDHPDARWWSEFVFPTLDLEYFGHYENEPTPYRFSSPCSALMRNPTEQDRYGQSLREMASIGQAEATDRWLSSGLFEPDREFWSCVAEDIPHFFRHSQAWNGGYDTPFWYAVHAIRTQHEAGLGHLPEITADIGEDCMVLAEDIAEGLRPIIPGPPVDDPQLRQLIVSSIACQPEGLRDPTEYWNENYHGLNTTGYLPPEAVFILPSFEPIFRRVDDQSEPEN